MTTIDRLKREAKAAADWRGHKMSKWYGGGRSSEKFCECEVCHARAYVDANPPANGIDVAGRAVALNCPWDRP